MLRKLLRHQLLSKKDHSFGVTNNDFQILACSRTTNMNRHATTAPVTLSHFYAAGSRGLGCSWLAALQLAGPFEDTGPGSVMWADGRWPACQQARRVSKKTGWKRLEEPSNTRSLHWRDVSNVRFGYGMDECFLGAISHGIMGEVSQLKTPRVLKLLFRICQTITVTKINTWKLQLYHSRTLSMPKSINPV